MTHAALGTPRVESAARRLKELNPRLDVVAAAENVAADNAARPWSLWRYALFLVLLIGLAESLLAVRYLSVEKEAA